jgi:hypothetical protein
MALGSGISWCKANLNSASTSNMWSPANISALPTPEELKTVKEVIDFLERDLENAIESLAQAQLRVEMLRKELEERKVWAAPARRLTFDVLSMIFEWCAAVEWDSPLRIAAVSRTWRSIVLDTPRAWAFPDVSSYKNNVNLFFERSRQRPLHVSLPSSRGWDLTSITHRIHCLSFRYVSAPYETLVFPNVQRLTMFGSGMLKITFINFRMFPALRQLVTVKRTLCHAFGSASTKLLFPRLESWSLRTSQNRAWFDGLRSCQNTLVSLKIYGHSYGIMDKHPPILFPVLRCLELMTGHVSNGRFNFMTPRLDSYGEDTDLLEGPMHTDVSTVTLMRFLVNGTPTLSLSCCLGLKRLLIYDGSNHVIDSVLDQLLADAGFCPVLQVIELYTNANIAPYLERLSVINRDRARAIDLVVSTKWTELPGSIPTSVSL